MELLVVLAQTAVILGDGFLVALRHCFCVAAAHLAGILVVELAPQLQLQLVNIGEHLGMQLLNERGIAGEAARVEAFHFLNEFLDLLGHLGIIAYGLAKLIQIAQAVVVGALRWNRRIVGLYGRPSARRVVPGVQIAVHRAIGAATVVRIAVRPGVVATADSCARTAVRAPGALIAAILLAAVLPLAQKTNEKCDVCGSPLILKWGKFGSFFACSAYDKKDPASCTFTKENTAAKPDMNTPEAQEAEESEEYCENCGRVMVLRRGPFGMFMACPGYSEDPPCKTIRKLTQKQQQKPPQPTGEDCPVCGKPLVLRQGAYGEFVSCSGYPKCKYIKQNLIEGMKCPKCGEGDIAERKARRGNIFWGCTNYPKCDFTSNYKPVPTKCPECGSPYLVEKTLKSGIYLECPNKKKGAEEEAKPKKRGKKTEAAPAEGAVVCTYSKRIGDAPPPPTAETHGPVLEPDSKRELQPA